MDHEQAEGRHSLLLSHIKSYFQRRLSITLTGMAYQEITGYLSARGIPEDNLSCLRMVIEECEAGSYGGGAEAGFSELRAKAIDCIKSIDRIIR